MAKPTVEDLQAFVKSEIARWGKVVQQAGIAGHAMTRSSNIEAREMAMLRRIAAIALRRARAPSAATPARKTIPRGPSPSWCPMRPAATPMPIARTLAQRLEQRLGQPFVIEQRLGAASVIGATHVARAAPDGYTILIGTSTTMAINVSVYKNLPYDPTRDLVPVALVAGVPFMLVVNPALPINSLADFVRVREDAAGRADLCLERRRRRRAPVRRAARRRARHQAGARALQGARAGAQRHRGRPRADDVRRLRHRAAAGAGRQAARARRLDRAAGRRRRRRSRRSPKSG